jgi:hypothetical protein
MSIIHSRAPASSNLSNAAVRAAVSRSVAANPSMRSSSTGPGSNRVCGIGSSSDWSPRSLVWLSRARTVSTLRAPGRQSSNAIACCRRQIRRRLLIDRYDCLGKAPFRGARLRLPGWNAAPSPHFTFKPFDVRHAWPVQKSRNFCKRGRVAVARFYAKLWNAHAARADVHWTPTGDVRPLADSAGMAAA